MNEKNILYKVTPEGVPTVYVVANSQGEAVNKTYAKFVELDAPGTQWRDTEKYNVTYVAAVIL